MTSAAVPEIDADKPPDKVVLAYGYQFSGLHAQLLDIGPGCRNIGLAGEVALQQPDALAYHGLGLGF